MKHRTFEALLTLLLFAVALVLLATFYLQIRAWLTGW